MDIAHLDPPSFGAQGDYVYRTAQPCRALGRLENVSVLCGTWLSPAMRAACAQSQVLVLNNTIDMDLLPLLARRRSAGLCTVYEVNDDLSVPHEGNHQRAFYDSAESRSLFFQLVAGCDGVQFTSHRLREKYGYLNSRSVVFPNQLWSMPPARRTDCSREGRVCVGWAGSEGHLADVKAIAPVLRDFVEAHSEVDLAIMGAPAIAALFRDIPRDRLKVVETSDLKGYLSFLSGLHIGVAPLLPTEFNLGRSDVKYLEYASSSVAAVCQRHGPYGEVVRDGVDGLLFSDDTELFSALARMLDHGQRSQIVQTAYAGVSESRLEQPHAQRRLDFYRELSREVAHDEVALGSSCADGSRFAEAYAMGEALPGGEGARFLEMSSSEHGLLDALLDQAKGGHGVQSLARARQLGPQNYLTEFYAGRVDVHYESRLSEAQALEGHACAPPYLLGLRRLADGRPREAQAAFETALRIHRDLAPAWFQLGRCHEALESLGAAMHAYRQAAGISSVFDPAVCALARLQMKLGRGREAVQTLQCVTVEVSEGGLTSTVESWLLLGKACLMTGDLCASSAALAQVLERAPDRYDVEQLLKRVNGAQEVSGERTRVAISR